MERIERSLILLSIPEYTRRIKMTRVYDRGSERKSAFLRFGSTGRGREKGDGVHPSEGAGGREGEREGERERDRVRADIFI